MSKHNSVVVILNEIIKCQKNGGLGFILIHKETKKEQNIYSEAALCNFINAEENMRGEYSFEPENKAIVFWDFLSNDTFRIAEFDEEEFKWSLVPC